VHRQPLCRLALSKDADPRHSHPQAKTVYARYGSLRVLVAGVVLPLVLYLYRDLTRDALIIEPFSVPKHFEETGLTPEVVANRICDALRQIETASHTGMRKDNLISLRDEGIEPDVEIPGAKIGLKSVVEIARNILSVYPKHISGDIVVPANSGLPSSKSVTTITIYFTQGRRRSSPISLVVAGEDIEVLAQHAAEAMFETEVSTCSVGQVECRRRGRQEVSTSFSGPLPSIA